MNRIVILTVGACIGALLTMAIQAAAASNSSVANPVYVVVSAAINDPDGISAYAEAAGPLAREAGIEVLARIPSVPDELVFEGAWPHGGGITIERFESMEAFESFWNSAAYQAAIPLRQGAVDINFVVAVPTD